MSGEEGLGEEGAGRCGESSGRLWARDGLGGLGAGVAGSANRAGNGGGGWGVRFRAEVDQARGRQRVSVDRDRGLC